VVKCPTRRRPRGGTDAPTIEALAQSEGAIVGIHGERVAAYSDEPGNLHALSPACTRLACYVN
jgi:hypothetical protein